MTFARNATHANDGIVKFAAPFWGKPRWAALFVALAREIQAIEDAAWDVVQKRMLANAGPAQLKVLGKLVGQTDPGLGDEVFRNLIRVRIRINRSNGGRNDVIEVLQLLGIPVANRTITPSYPAKIRVDFTGPLPLPIDIMTRLINDTLSAGVGAFVIWDPDSAPIEEGFAYSNNTFTATGNDSFSDNSLNGVGRWSGVWQV